MKTIELTKGKVALIDDEDYAHVSLVSWSARQYGHLWYAQGELKIGPAPNDRINLRMHHIVMRVGGWVLLDHINGDGLDNRKCNLRRCTPQQNRCNGKPHMDRKFKGVYPWPSGRFYAQVRGFGVRHHLGTFDTEEDAARAYDAKARELFGEFARTNF